MMTKRYPPYLLIHDKKIAPFVHPLLHPESTEDGQNRSENGYSLIPAPSTLSWFNLSFLVCRAGVFFFLIYLYIFWGLGEERV